MCVILPRSRFIHIPKTGGTWVRHALAVSGLSALSDAGLYKHATPVVAPGRAQFSFAFVRNPWNWWSSFWSYRVETDWVDATSTLEREWRSDDYTTFVTQMLRLAPGYLTAMYDNFLGSESNPHLDFIGRTEQLEDDLVRALELAGETNFYQTNIRSTPRVNTRTLPKERTALSEELIAAIGEAEQGTVSRFKYLPPQGN